MVILDGRVYRIAGDGRVHEVTEPAASPFACVTYYAPVSHDDLGSATSYEQFLGRLDGLLPSQNLFYALRVEGRFADVRVRSVSRQENYLPLVEVAKHQAEFTFAEAEGTLAGFFTPSFLGSLSVPGLHLHFLSADRTEGGHLLSCRPLTVHVGVQFISTLELGLPMSLDYLTWDFRRDSDPDLEQAET